jgi:hypothetical protein
MKILCFGDEVVIGDGASGGFREPLESYLTSAHVQFEFVGSRTDNSFQMEFPRHEGFRGADLSGLRIQHLGAAMATEPDVMLLYAGSRDVKSLPDSGIAVARYGKLLKAALDLKPDMTVLCSQIIPAKDHVVEQKVKLFNRLLGSLVEEYAAKRLKVNRIKMHAKIKTEMLNEQGMPNETGYREMAKAWGSAIDDLTR